MAFDPNLHPRGPDGKFSGGPGTRGSQRRLPRLGEALGYRIGRALRGNRGPAKPKPEPTASNWGIYADEAEFDAAATLLERGGMTPEQRRRHQRQVDAWLHG